MNSNTGSTWSSTGSTGFAALRKAGRHRWNRRERAAIRGHSGNARIDLGDGVDRSEKAASDRRPPSSRQATNGVEDELLVVGWGWTTSAKPLKATTPIWVLLAWWAMKSDAACSAARRRVGAISEVSEFVEVQRPQPLDIVPPSVVDSARCHYLADAPLEHLLKRWIGRIEQAHQGSGQEPRRPTLHVLNLDEAR